MDVSVRDGRCYEFGGFVLDPTRRVLKREDAVVPLSPTLFDTLVYLVERAGCVVSRDELMEAIWPRKVVEESNISQTIFTLRKALAAAGAGESLIATHPGQGYRFAGPVQVLARGTAPMTATRRVELGNVPAWAAAPPTGGARPGPSRLAVGGLRGNRLGLAAILALSASAGLGTWVWRSVAPPPGPAAKTIVLAEFENLSREPLFDRTFTEATRIDLYQSPFINVLPEAKVKDTLSLMTRSQDERLTPAIAQEVCTRNNAAAAVSGAIAQVGARYLLTLTATDCAGGSVLAAEKAVVGSREALLSTLDGLVARLRRKLGESAASVRTHAVPLVGARTASLEALQAFSEGRYVEAHGDPLRAKALYQHAIELDPNFAMAYAGLSAVDYNAHDFERARVEAAKAYALRSYAGERDRYRIVSRYDEGVSNDTLESIEDYKTWASAYPQDAVAWANLSNAENWLGRYREAIAPARRALALAPEAEASYVVLARAYMHDGQVDAAAAICAQAMAKGLAGEGIHGLLTEIAAARGDDAGVEREVAWARGKSAERTVLIFAARNAYREGRARRGEELYDQASALSKAQGLDDYTLPFRAREMADLGLKDQAMRILRRIPDRDDGDSDTIFSIAELGDEARAGTLIRDALARGPHDTLNANVFAPEARAALALRHGRTQAAIAALAQALPFEMRAFDTPYLRGRIYLAAKDGDHAALEFRKILGHPDIEPTSPLRPLAELGLARALRLQNDRAGSLNAYGRLLVDWKDADPDLPPLHEARMEFAALGGRL